MAIRLLGRTAKVKKRFGRIRRAASKVGRAARNPDTYMWGAGLLGTAGGIKAGRAYGKAYDKEAKKRTQHLASGGRYLVAKNQYGETHWVPIDKRRKK